MSPGTNRATALTSDWHNRNPPVRGHVCQRNFTGSSNLLLVVALGICAVALLLLGGKELPITGTLDQQQGSATGSSATLSPRQSAPLSTATAESPTAAGNSSAQGPSVQSRTIAADSTGAAISPAAEDALRAHSLPRPRHVNPETGRRIPPKSADSPGNTLEEAKLAVAGRVLDTAGESIPGVELMLTTVRLFEDAEQTAPLPGVSEQFTLTDFDGRYTFGSLFDGEYRIRSMATGNYAPAQITVRAGMRSADLVLAQESALRVHGVVENNDGSPLAGVMVTPILPWASGVTTDQNGRYQFFVNLESTRDSYSVRFQHNDYREKFVKLLESDWLGRDTIWVDASLEPVEATGGVAGVVRSSSGAPLAGEVVLLYSPTLGRRYHSATNQAGEFLISDVETAQDYRLSVHPSAEYRDYERDNLGITAEGVYFDVVLEPLNLGRLAGQMVDVEGNFIPGFTLLLHSDSASNQSFRVTGDSQGYFFVDGVSAGELILETSSSPSFTVSGIDLRAGDERELPVVLDWGRNVIEGLVVDSSGQPVAMAKITLTWAFQDNDVRSSSSRDTVADSQGHFRFEQLGPGLHTVHINAPGFNQVRIDHDVGGRGRELVVQLKETI